MRKLFCILFLLWASVAQAAAYQIKQSTTTWALVFFMTDSSDHVTGKTGLTVTVTLSKNGGSFGAASGSVTEIASGWYKVAGNATDSNTLGPLALHATATGADPTDMLYEVVAVDPQSATAFVTGINSLAPPTNWNLTSIDSNGRLDVIKLAGTSQTARDIGASVLLSPGTGAGQILLSSGAVTVGTNSDKTGYSLTQTFPTNFSALAITAGGAVTVGTLPTIPANWITAAGVAADVTTELQTGLATAANLATVDTVVDSILVDTNELQTDWVDGGRLDLILDARASQTSVNTVDTVVDAIKVTTDKLDSTLELDGGPYRFTTNALEQGPTGGGASAASIADAVWDEARSGHTTAGTYGEGILISVGTGNGQLAITSGAVNADLTKVNTVSIAGDAIGDNFKTFFNNSDNSSTLEMDLVESYNSALSSLASEVALVKAKTNNLPASPAAVGSAMTLADGAITAPKIGADAFTASKFHSDVTTEFQTGLSTAANLATVDGILDNIFTAFELDGSVYRLTTNALEQAPTGGGGGGGAVPTMHVDVPPLAFVPRTGSKKTRVLILVRDVDGELVDPTGQDIDLTWADPNGGAVPSGLPATATRISEGSYYADITIPSTQAKDQRLVMYAAAVVDAVDLVDGDSTQFTITPPTQITIGQ